MKSSIKKKQKIVKISEVVDNLQNIIKPIFIGKSVINQFELDDLLKNKYNGFRRNNADSILEFYRNLILTTSISILRAGANSQKMPIHAYISKLLNKSTEKFILPVPFFMLNLKEFNKIKGPIFNELFVIPNSAQNFKEALKMSYEIYQLFDSLYKNPSQNVEIVENAKSKLGLRNKNDIELMLEEHILLETACYAIKKLNLLEKVKLGLKFYTNFHDKAFAYNLYDRPNYENKFIDIYEYIKIPKKICELYPIISCINAIDELDYYANSNFERFSENCQFIQMEFISKQIKKSDFATHFGLNFNPETYLTVSEIINKYRKITENKVGVSIFANYEKLNDTFFYELAIGLGLGHIKCGYPLELENNLYKQIMKIEENIGENGIFAGQNFAKIH